MIRFSLLCALALVPLPALAATWVVDPASSSVAFSGTQDGQDFTAKFTSFTAQISFDPMVMEGSSVDVTLPLASIDSPSPMVMENILTTEWLAAAQFPEARFVATSFHKTDDSHFEATGTLTIRNITLPLTLPFTFTESEGVAHVTASVTLKRNDFGVGQGSWATDPSVGQDVKVDIALVAKAVP